MRYFDHDTDAMTDESIQALRLECGGGAVDAYWAIIERIYKDEADLTLGENQPLTKSVTYWLGLGFDELKNYFSTMHEVGLLNVVENSDGTFTLHSERASENIEKYRKRLETARQNGAKGGRKPKPNRKQTKAKPNPNRTLTKPKAKEKEKEKLLDTHKGYPNNCAERGADAENAPRTAIECPKCGAPMRATNQRTQGTGRRLYLCDECGEEAESWG